MKKPKNQAPVEFTEQGLTRLPNLCSIEALFMLVVAAELLAVLLSVASHGLAELSWAHLGLVSALVLWITLGSAALICTLRPSFERLPQVAAWLLAYLLILLCAGFFSALGQWLLKGLGRGFMDWWQVASHVLIAAIIAGMLLRYLYLLQHLRAQQQAELRARIQALQSRIEPHFLFNSMNSIASLIAVDPDLAERLVEDLADLFRAALAQTSMVSAERELALTRAYLRIEQLRLSERLRLSWNVQAPPEGAQLPNLLLQPLVENAIYHGVEASRTGGDVAVELTFEGRSAILTVRNSVPDAPHIARRTGHNMGLDNVRHRLQAFYGTGAQLVVEQLDQEFSVRIRIVDTAAQPASSTPTKV
ncbi:sensor histidine kinase [Gilvimarinus polysaccharolyticus]|uniref:sensor histidine kinase n=1 Tax=Gilvimarinus polysaccharolyticus TaxID=863921 RepID=UPI0006734AB5|nr:histidine kinase [Gilvimarinus polysaccharolyticus]